MGLHQIISYFCNMDMLHVLHYYRSFASRFTSKKDNGNHLVHETKGNSSISANYYDRRSLGQWSRFSVRYWVKYPLLHNSFCWSQHVLKSNICSCLYYIESSWIAIGFSFFSLNLDIKLYIQRCLWVYNITHFLDFCPFVKYNKKGIQQ